MQSALVMQPHCPSALHSSGMVGVPAHIIPGLGVLTGVLPLHVSVVHTFLSSGTSPVLGTVWVPPVPLHTTFLQSPVTCGGLPLVTVPMGAKAVAQVWLVHEGCWQSLVVPG